MKHLRRLGLVLTYVFIAKTRVFGAEGFEFGGMNVGYMSKDEFCPAHVSVEEISAFIAKLNAVLVEFYRSSTDTHQFDVVIVVHRGHVHFWFVGRRGERDRAEFEKLHEKLRYVAPPKLTREPIGFSLEARIAGGPASKPGPSTKPPAIPKEWNGAAAKDRSDLQLHFDGLVDLLCPPGATLSSDRSVRP